MAELIINNRPKTGQPPEAGTLILLAFSATAVVMVEFYDPLIVGYAAACAFPKGLFSQSLAGDAVQTDRKLDRNKIRFHSFR